MTSETPNIEAGDGGGGWVKHKSMAIYSRNYNDEKKLAKRNMGSVVS